MIRDLSETMRAILDDPAPAFSGAFPELAAAQILFDRPVEGFNPSRATVDLFLYDVRENMELRSNEPIVERNGGQALIHRPPLRVLCSYLVTAWSGNVTGDELALGEHRLLSQTLQALSRFPTIPPQYLKGSLVKQEPPLPMITARAEALKEPAEFWTAIGNKLRPSISLTVTISMQPFEPEIADLVTASDLRLGERALPIDDQHPNRLQAASLQGPFRVVGKVTDNAQPPKPIAGATVKLTSLHLTGITDVKASIHFETKTDASGVYRFTQSLASGEAAALVAPGTYTLRVTKDTKQQEVEITVPAPAGGNYNVTLTG